MPCASRVTIRRAVSPLFSVSGSGSQESVIDTSRAGSHQGSAASGPPVAPVQAATGKGTGSERTSICLRSPLSLMVRRWMNGSMVKVPVCWGKTAMVRSNSSAI